MFYVWDCGDEMCGCSQARITAIHRNKTFVTPNSTHRGYVYIDLWSGEWHSEGEPGAADDLQQAINYLTALEQAS